MNMYLIKCTKGKKKGGYLSIDHNSGGYPYWGTLNDCRMYNNFKDAEIALNDYCRLTYLHNGVEEISIIELEEKISYHCNI